jgi:hypothetical protein
MAVSSRRSLKIAFLTDSLFCASDRREFAFAARTRFKLNQRTAWQAQQREEHENTGDAASGTSEDSSVRSFHPANFRSINAKSPVDQQESGNELETLFLRKSMTWCSPIKRERQAVSSPRTLKIQFPIRSAASQRGTCVVGFDLRRPPPLPSC